MVDGSSRLRAFLTDHACRWSRPGLVATGVFAFIQAWNEFIFALVIMNRPEHQTLPVWLQAFNEGARGTDWGGVMAGSTLMAIPVIIFFLLVQRRVASRADRRGGEGMTCDRATPAVDGVPARRRSAGRTRRRGCCDGSSDGLGGVCLFGDEHRRRRPGGRADAELRAAARRRRDRHRRGGRRRHPPGDGDGSSTTRATPRSGASTTSRLTDGGGAGLGAELAAAGVDLDLAPCADINSQPGQPGDRRALVRRRRRSSSPATSRPFVGGLHGGRGGRCAKHFPGHGDTGADSHLGRCPSCASRSTSSGDAGAGAVPRPRSRPASTP